MLKAQGASEDLLKAQQAKVKKASHDIDDFCEETGRARRTNRERTPIKADFPDAKVVMVSAAGQQHNMVEAVQSGAAEFIAKPFDVDAIKVIINNILEA